MINDLTLTSSLWRSKSLKWAKNVESASADFMNFHEFLGIKFCENVVIYFIVEFLSVPVEGVNHFHKIV